MNEGGELRGWKARIGKELRALSNSSLQTPDKRIKKMFAFFEVFAACHKFLDNCPVGKLERCVLKRLLGVSGFYRLLKPKLLVVQALERKCTKSRDLSSYGFDLIRENIY